MDGGLRCVLFLVFVTLAACSGGDGADPAQGRLIVQSNLNSLDGRVAGQINVLDDGCVVLNDGVNRLGILWPLGTTWDEETATVVLEDSTVIVDGMFLESSGATVVLNDEYIAGAATTGYLKKGSVRADARSCVEGEQFVAIAKGSVTVIDG